jgi:hypothetical protein
LSPMCRISLAASACLLSSTAQSPWSFWPWPPLPEAAWNAARTF